MSTVMEDRLAKAREQVQELHKKMDAARAKGHEAMQNDFKTIGTRAGELSATIKELSAQDRADMQKHLSLASNALHEAAEHAKTAAGGQQTKANEAAQAALANARTAVQKLSESIAAHRNAAKGEKTPAKV